MILDPIFIYVFDWGVAGAAWATFIGQLLNAAFFLFSMTRCKSVKLEKKKTDRGDEIKTEEVKELKNI